MSSGIPRTLDECFIALKGGLLKPHILRQIQEMTEEAFRVHSHFGLGRYIRNAWGLWTSSELKNHMLGLGLEHPDDMSSVILTSFWRHLHGVPLDVEGQISHFQEYWKQMRGSK